MQLLKLRYYQLRRDLGYWVIIIAGIVFYFSSQLSVLRDPYPLVLPAVVILFLFNYHLNRSDLNFISKYLSNPKQQVLVNYNLLILPLSLGMVFSLGWMYSILAHVLVTLAGLTETKFSYLKLTFISKYIPPSQFEWISGLRSNFFMILILILLAFILSPVKLFGLAALFLANIIFLGFYNFYEPLLMLNTEQLSKESFLNRKINYLIKMILLVNLPVLIVNSIFNPDVLSFNLFFLIGMVLLAACTVYIKYAFYKPNEQQAFNMDFLILIASVFLPYFLPLSLLIYYNNRKKAKNNLSHYLDDQS